VTSSTGVSEVIRRGCDSGDRVEEIDTRDGKRKDVGAVIESFVSELYVVAWNDRFGSLNDERKVRNGDRQAADRRSTFDRRVSTFDQLSLLDINRRKHVIMGG
jgi:hypothetical protein